MKAMAPSRELRGQHQVENKVCEEDAEGPELGVEPLREVSAKIGSILSIRLC